MAAGDKISFKRGTKTQYEGLQQKDSNTLYFLTDGDIGTNAGELYLGETLLTNTIKSASYSSANNELTLTTQSNGTVVAKLEGSATEDYVKDEIAKAISTVYKVKGSASVDTINALADQENGDVWNVTTNGTITYGEGGTSMNVAKGDNVVWIEDETLTSRGYWDKLAGTLDVSGKMDKVSDATINNIATFAAGGQVKDSEYSITTSASETPDTKKIPTEVVVSSMIGDAVDDKFVQYDETQSLTDDQKTQARANIDAIKKLDSTTSENKIILSSTSGEIKSSGKAIGGENLNSTPDVNTLATELAVSNALETVSVKWEDIVQQ